MNKIFVVLFLSAVFSTPILAQAQSEDFNKAEVFTGYSGATRYTGDDFEPIENGFNVSAVYNVHRYVGIKADFSGTYRKLKSDYASFSSSFGPYKANHSLYNAAAGVQFKDNRRESGVKPFGHVLVGYGKHFDKVTTGCPSAGSFCLSSEGFEGVSLIIGGGLDVKLNRRIDIRVIQFDLNPIFHRYEGETFIWANNRFSSGVVFKF